MKQLIKWRLGALAFVIMAIAFASLNQRLAYIIDAVGLSGNTVEADVEKPIQEEAAAVKKPNNAPKKKGPAPFTSAGSRIHNGYLCLKAPKPLKIDGLADDWDLRTGQFFCVDCDELTASESAWIHTMYDEQGLYVFSRVRHSQSLLSDKDHTADPKNLNFVQVAVMTDQPVAINLWSRAGAGGTVQLHYFMPKNYPRDDKTEKKDGLFSADDAIYREDGLKQGAKIATFKHIDEGGVDLECFIPWTALCKDVANRPLTNRYTSMSMGTHLNDTVVGDVQLTTNKQQVKFSSAWLLEKGPLNPPPVLAFRGGRGKPQLYPVMLASGHPSLKVDWSKPSSTTMPACMELPVISRSGITVDGKPDEWSPNAEIIIGDDLERRAYLKLRAATDDSNLYLFATVNDPTPMAGGDLLTFKLKTNAIHTLEITRDRLELNGKNALKTGATLKSELIEDNRGYVGYTLETAIPWKLFSENGTPKKTFPVTALISMNPVWAVAGLVSIVATEEEQSNPTYWGTATVMKEPENPIPIRFASGSMLMPPSEGKLPKGLGPLPPFKVYNLELDVLPGTVTVDGDISDWKLTRGMFMCQNIRLFADSQAVWVHAMYDDTMLYLLYRFTDSTPMANTGNSFNWQDDSVECYLGAKGLQVRHSYSSSTGKAYTTIMGKEFDKVKNELTKSIQVAFKMNDDETGYVQEVAIPLKWLFEKMPLEGSETLPMHIQARTTPSFSTFGPTAYPNIGTAGKNIKFFGTAKFLTDTPQKPNPVKLLNGMVLPVNMVDGRPVIDRSQLP